jgi:hypothetical protein
MGSAAAPIDLMDIWKRVMREGAPMEDVARELSVSVSQLEQLLLQAGRERIKDEPRPEA